MKRLAPLLLALSLLSLALAPQALASLGFKVSEVGFVEEDGSPATQAGSHPFAFKTTFEAKTKVKGGLELPDEEFKDLEVNLPPGLVGTPTPVPRCSEADFIAIESSENDCPDSAAVGTIEVAAGTSAINVGEEPFEATNVGTVPVYNLIPPPGVASEIGFVYLGLPVTIENGLNPTPPYNLQGRAANISQAALFYGSRLVLWGVPADPRHDPDRGKCALSSTKECPAGLPQIPFLTLPRSCAGPLSTAFEADSWQHPGIFTKPVFASSPAITGCEKLGFDPTISARPTSSAAESPSGLDFSLDVHDEGLTAAAGTAKSDLQKAVVTLPEGVTINPSQAEGLGVCSIDDYNRESLDTEAGGGCPDSSKIGTIEVESPLLPNEVLKGGLFVAKPYENLADNSLIALYMVFRNRELGIVVKQAARVEPDPRTGQLITTAENIPQLPFSHFRLHFREGGRSPLVTPPRCGTFTATALLTPWANPSAPYPTSASFKVASGAGGGPCPPGGVPPFHAGFAAGTQSNAAGQFSPFSMRLTREDGDQDLTRFSAKLPPGLSAKLAGVSQCPEAAIAAARARSGPHAGAEELANPSCPASSQIGSVLAGAGVGPELTYVPGRIYLAGPFAGAPLSVLGIVPAVAGPFDVGVVVTRFALQVDPKTAEASIDGTRSDPIPHILAGIPLKVRDIRAFVNRPQFTLNPTSCDPFTLSATLWGGGSNVFSSADDVPFAKEDRFQAANCQDLAFKPKLALKLTGPTNRGAFPALRATYTARVGDANLKSLVLRLPHSEFVEQGHFRTICTRVQYAQKACPKGSVYGHVRAFTPLLAEPLEGPVYLRSSNHNLPDVVLSLHGLIDAEATARIDSIKGKLRARVEAAPDVPVSKVVVNMQGAQKGLIVNSTNLCAAKHHASVAMEGQNSKSHDTRPLVGARCPKRKH